MSVYFRLSNKILPRINGPVFVREFSLATSIKNDNIKSSVHLRNDRSIVSIIHDLQNAVKNHTAIQKVSIKNVLDGLGENEMITRGHSQLLLRCCGYIRLEETDQSKAELIAETWNTLKKYDVPLDISHYNILLNVYQEVNHDFSPIEFLENLQKNDIQPNRATMTHLIHKLCLDGDTESAKKLLDVMNDLNLSLNREIFVSFLQGFNKQNDIDGCQEVFSLMKMNNIEPDGTAYAIMADVHLKRGDIEAFDELLKECQSHNMLQTSSLSEMAAMLIKNGRKELLSKVFDNIKHIDPSTIEHRCIWLLIRDSYYEEACEFAIEKSSQGNIALSCFFLEALARSIVPFDDIVKYCKKIHGAVSDPSIFTNVLKVFLQENHSYAVKFLKIMNEFSCEVRHHYYYPLIYGKKGDDVSSIIQEMYNNSIHLPLFVWHNTIIPLMDLPREPKEAAEQLFSQFGFAKRDCFHGLFFYYLLNKNYESVFTLANAYNKMSIPNISARYIPTSYIEGVSAADVVYLLKRLGGKYNSNVVRNFLENLIGLLSIEKYEILVPLLNEMAKNSLFLHESHSLKIKELIGGENMTSAIEEGLSNIILSEDKCKEFQEIENQRLEYALVNACTKEEFKRVEGILNVLYERGVELDPRTNIKLVSHYLKSGNLNRVEEFCNKLSEDFKLSPILILKYALLLASKNKMSDAAKVLLVYSPEDGNWPVKENYSKEKPSLALCRNLMSTVLKNGSVEDYNLVKSNLIDRNFYFPTDFISTDVELLLESDGLDAALDFYMKSGSDFIPTNLIKACIQHENSEKLESLANYFCKSVYHEKVFFSKLAVLFIEEGRIVQAESILKTPGLKANFEYLREGCKYFLQKDEAEKAKQLVQVTKHLHGFDRHSLFLLLLSHYEAENMVDDALDLWTILQEDDENESDEFLLKLAKILKDNGRNIPFVIPKHSINNTVEPATMVPHIERPATTVPHIESLLNHIEADNYDKFISEMKSCFSENSNFVEFESSNYRRIWGYFIFKADIETISSFMDQMKIENYLAKKLVSRCLRDNLWDIYLKYVEKSYNDSKFLPDTSSFARIAFSKPELENNMIKLAEKYEKLHVRIWNGILDAKLSKGEYEEADKIYKEHLAGSKLYLNKTFYESKKKEDVEKLEKVLEFFKDKNQPLFFTGLIYSCMISIMGENGKFEEGLKIIEKSLNDISLSDYSYSLTEFRKKCENAGYAFPYEIESNITIEKK